jgi:cell division ATPase FtsA
MKRVLNFLQGLKVPLKKSDPYFYTVDLGSDTVKVLLNKINEEDSKLEIIHSHKEALPANSFELNFEDKIVLYEKALKDSMSEIEGESKVKTSNLIVSLNGKFCRGITTTLRVTRHKDLEIKLKEKNEILEKLFEGAYEEISEIIYQESFIKDPELEVLDYYPNYIEIDGNQVFDIEGESGKEIDISYTIFFVYSDKMLLLKQMLKNLKLKNTQIIPSSYALTHALKQIKKEKVDCVILDIGGSLTEIIACFRGGVYLNKILSIGGSDFTDTLSKKLNLTYFNAEKIKRYYSFGKLKEKENVAVQNVVLEVLQMWALGIEETFNDFKDVKTFSSEFYLVGGGSDLPDIKEHLFEESWTKAIPFKSTPEFKNLDVRKLKDLELTEEVRNSEDILPVLVSYFYFSKTRNLI